MTASASHGPSLHPSPRPDVLIVGAGIVGLTCAEALDRAGLRVEIWERDSAPALGASGASAGMLAPLAEVPEDSSFFGMCRAARDLWVSFAPRLAAETGLALDYDCSGALVADHPTLGIDVLKRTAEKTGEPWQELDAAQALELVPDLTPRIPRWLHLPGEHRIDNQKVCRALAAKLRARGVVLRTGHPLHSVRRETVRPGQGVFVAQGATQRLQTQHVILAAGAWSARPISGIPGLPVHPVKGQMLRLSPVDWPFEGCLRFGHAYAARRCGEPGGRSLESGRRPKESCGALLVGATVEPKSGFDTQVTAGGLAELLEFAGTVAPGLLRRPVVETWAGLRPGSLDGRPLLGPLEEGLWAATGHYRNGILLAPWSAEYLTGWIVHGRPPNQEASSLLDPLRGPSTAGSPAKTVVSSKPQAR